MINASVYNPADQLLEIIIVSKINLNNLLFVLLFLLGEAFPAQNHLTLNTFVPINGII